MIVITVIHFREVVRNYVSMGRIRESNMSPFYNVKYYDSLPGTLLVPEIIIFKNIVKGMTNSCYLPIIQVQVSGQGVVLCNLA